MKQRFHNDTKHSSGLLHLFGPDISRMKEIMRIFFIQRTISEMTTSVQVLKNGLQSNLLIYQSIGALLALARPKIKQRTPGLSDLLMLC